MRFSAHMYLPIFIQHYVNGSGASGYIPMIYFILIKSLYIALVRSKIKAYLKLLLTRIVHCLYVLHSSKFTTVVRKAGYNDHCYFMLDYTMLISSA